MDGVSFRMNVKRDVHGCIVMQLHDLNGLAMRVGRCLHGYSANVQVKNSIKTCK